MFVGRKTIKMKWLLMLFVMLGCSDTSDSPVPRHSDAEEAEHNVILWASMMQLKVNNVHCLGVFKWDDRVVNCTVSVNQDNVVKVIPLHCARGATNSGNCYLAKVEQ